MAALEAAYLLRVGRVEDSFVGPIPGLPVAGTGLLVIVRLALSSGGLKCRLGTRTGDAVADQSVPALELAPRGVDR